jgi:hypothetical protein
LTALSEGKGTLQVLGSLSEILSSINRYQNILANRENWEVTTEATAQE